MFGAVEETPYRIPNFLLSSSQGLVPAPSMIRLYSYYVPYILGLVHSFDQYDPSSPTFTWTWVYNQPTDSDFLLIKQAATSESVRLAALNNNFAVAIRIPNVIDVTYDYTAADLLFPVVDSKNTFPFYFEFPIFVQGGETLQYDFRADVAAQTDRFVFTAYIYGVRLYR